MASITCGKCKGTHYAVSTVRLCYSSVPTFTCDWQYEETYNEDGERPVLECGALAWEDRRGVYCENGHEHIHAEVRANEGWDYAEDEQEAGALLALGVRSVGMDGGSINPDLGAFRQVLAG
jgi:hypothetical protein